MRSLVVFVILALISFVPVSVCYGDGTATEPMLTEEVALVAADETAETEDVVDDWTASLPVHAGFLWNADRKEWTQYINLTPVSYRDVTAELGLEVNPNEGEGPTGGILALTYDLGNLRDYGVTVHWAEYFGVNVGPFLRYDFGTGEWEKGILASVVDFSGID